MHPEKNNIIGKREEEGEGEDRREREEEGKEELAFDRFMLLVLSHCSSFGL